MLKDCCGYDLSRPSKKTLRDTFDPPAKIVPAKVILNLCYDWSIDITKKLRQGFGKKKRVEKEINILGYAF